MITLSSGLTKLNRALQEWLVGSGVQLDSLSNDVISFFNPALDLYFQARTYSMGLVQKSFSDIITFTRADATSCATRTNELGLIEVVAANVPRIDYDPVTRACKGLLVEESRTNLLLYSEDFTTTWNANTTMAMVPDAATSPTGSATADRMTETLIAASRSTYQDATVTAGATVAFTTYGKEDLTSAKRYLQLALSLSTGGNDYVSARFDLATGTVTESRVGTTLTIFPTAPTASCVDTGNGWYRCQMVATPATTTTLRARIGMCASGTGITGAAYGFLSYTGDGTSGLYLWGAQLEAGTFPTSYIPTTTAQVTRAADLASMAGANFSSWFNQSEGTFVAAALADNYASAGAQVRCFLSAGNGLTSTSQEGYEFGRGASTAIRARFYNTGVHTPVAPAAATAFGTITSGQADKFAAGYSLSVPTLVLNGVTANAGTPPFVKPSVVDRMMIGGSHATTSSLYVLNGHIKRITYYPTRLTDAQLQALTA